MIILITIIAIPVQLLIFFLFFFFFLQETLFISLKDNFDKLTCLLPRVIIKMKYYMYVHVCTYISADKHKGNVAGDVSLL